MKKLLGGLGILALVAASAACASSGSKGTKTDPEPIWARQSATAPPSVRQDGPARMPENLRAGQSQR